MGVETYYLVKSGAGHFIQFYDGRQPFLTTDPVEARRFPNIEAADGVCHEMQVMGWVADVVVVTCIRRFARNRA